MKILTIDDEPQIQDLLKIGLRRYGYEVEGASSPQEGLSRLENDQFDMALVDMKMPGMEGWEICKVLRENARTRDLSIIMITGQGDIESKMKGFEAGADDYILKPFHLLEVKARIENVAAKRGGTARIRELLGRYVSEDALEEILKNPAGLELGGEEKEVTILFSDLRSFSHLCSKLEPKRLIRLLNDYFTAMEEIVCECGGMVDKYIGDAVMAVFGAPNPRENHAADAVRAAMRMLRRLDVLNCEMAAREGVAFQAGIGIHTGPVVIGNIGSLRRMEYTVIGENVNIAARMETLAKELHRTIVMTAATRSRLEDGLAAVSLGRAQVRGFPEPIEIFAPQLP